MTMDNDDKFALGAAIFILLLMGMLIAGSLIDDYIMTSRPVVIERDCK